MQRTFETYDSPVTLDLRVPTGEITIDPSLDGRVEVELIAHDEESQSLVDAARVEQSGERILVDVPSKGRSFGLSFFFGQQGITCRVKCPPSSNAEVRTKSADVEALGKLGKVSVSTASGDVEVRDVEADLTVKSASGDVRAGHVFGAATVQTASGDVAFDFVGGTAKVQTVSGDVRIGEAAADANVTTVSGDQHYEAVHGGSVTAQAVSGDVLVAVRRGARVYLDCNTLSGDTSSDLDMTGEPAGDGPLIEIRAKTVSGDIKITRAPAPADSAQEVHA
jgi:DUF4097 and DUF4098 domain-containing protein YvlB